MGFLAYFVKVIIDIADIVGIVSISQDESL